MVPESCMMTLLCALAGKGLNFGLEEAHGLEAH